MTLKRYHFLGCDSDTDVDGLQPEEDKPSNNREHEDEEMQYMAQPTRV